MHSLTTTLTTTALLLLALPSTLAQDTTTITSAPSATATDGDIIAGGITGNNNVYGVDGSGTYCPGVLNANPSSTYCCVGGSLTLSSCAGWPICTGPVTINTETQSESCVTRVDVTQSDYSEVVQSYSASFDGGAQITGAASSESESSESSAMAGESSTDSMGSTSGGSMARETAAGASSTSSGNAAAAATGMGLEIGVVAGGFLGLAALL